MADFISLHHEEWVALISGLRFSAAVAKANLILIPVVIFVLGLSLLIWLYRLEKYREWNAFVLWLIFSSAIILTSFRTQNVDVQLIPIVLNSNSMVEGLDKNKIKVKDKQENEQTTYSIYYETEASGISALLAIPDKIASLMFNFMDKSLLKKLTGHAKTIPLDNMACRDPRFVAGLIQLLALDWALGLSMKGDDKVEVFDARARAFEVCYRDGFEGDIPFTSIKGWFDFKLKDFTEGLTRGAITLGLASSFILLAAQVSLPALAITAAVAFAAGVATKAYDLFTEKDGRGLVRCGRFVDAFKDAAEQIVKNCEELLGVKMEDKDKETFVKAVLACLAKPDEIPDTYSGAKSQCLELREKTLFAIEMAKQAVDKRMNISSDTHVKNFFAGVVTTAKEWWYSATYMSYPLKFDMLAKGQGIVLALLTATFPFVAVLSVIPTESDFMNWRLLLSYIIAYFMVKLWIPLLYFIVFIATHELARITGG
jgi:hypothetical protein